MPNRNTCPICKKSIVGRSDKKFCSMICKSEYHRRLINSTNEATRRIDTILHRNRSILLEMMGKNRQQIKVPLIQLEKRKFNFNYITKYIINSQGKTYNYVYDFAWMTFSTNEILIIRSKR
jgi:hypothetical protein